MCRELLIFSLMVAIVTSQHKSPCPEIFKYTQNGDEPGKWTGQITLNTEYPLSGVWIRFVLDRKVDSVKSKFGEVVPREPKDHLIKDRDYNLVPGTPLSFPISVHYNVNEPIPSVVSLRLNGRTVCPVTPTGTLSQCPGVFRYNKDKSEKNMWHGTIVLDTEFDLKGVWIRVVLDRPAEILGNEFGEVHTTDNLSYLIKNPNHTLVPGQPISLPFWVKYAPDQPAPTIQTVRLNGRTVCGPILAQDNHQNIIFYPLLAKFGFLPPTTTKLPTIPVRQPIAIHSHAPSEPQVIIPAFNPPQMANSTDLLDTSSNAYISCGTVVPESINLITFGEQARSAQWPWHGAIYLIKPKSLEYICGMSLISDKHALTAAHCVVESVNTKKLRDPKSMVLYFGLLNRKDFTASTVQKPTVESIYIHDDYKVSENDIAVIKFERKVKFTDFVRPVCLWEGDMDMRYIVNQTGTVVGFGVTETGAISDELLYADILVVDTPTCIFSHRDFYSKYTSLNTYCAGNLTRSAVCNGDSGGAMVFRRAGSDVWQIRGIVSTAVRNVDTGLCDYNYYAIFTDAAKYTSWIEKILAQ